MHWVYVYRIRKYGEYVMIWKLKELILSKFKFVKVAGVILKYITYFYVK